jgi:hypothetical protein
MERRMIIAVPMTQWSWLEDVLDSETSLPTGKKVRQYGLFWNWLHSSFNSSWITPTFQNLISEVPKQMVRAGTTYGIEIIPVSRFQVGDYDTWANGMLTNAITNGVDITATTCLKSNQSQWFSDNGFEHIYTGE